MAEDWSLGLVAGLVIGFPLGIIPGWFIVTRLASGALQSMSTPQPSQHAQPAHVYSNIEKWEIIKDERGRTRGIRVHRTAKEG